MALDPLRTLLDLTEVLRPGLTAPSFSNFIVVFAGWIRTAGTVGTVLVDERLPLVDLPDLVLEVDGWTRFSDQLEHARGHEPRSKDLQVNCCASILAQAPSPPVRERGERSTPWLS